VAFGKRVLAVSRCAIETDSKHIRRLDITFTSSLFYKRGNVSMKPPANPFDTTDIVEHLYDIALEPMTLDGFIDAWNDAGLDASEARKAVTSIDQFDANFQAHLERAGTFLDRGQHAPEGPDLQATLAPFGSLAAFIVNDSKKIVASNAGATSTFGIETGDVLDTLPFSTEAGETLTEGLASVFKAKGPTLRLLRVESTTKTGPALFQIRRIFNQSLGDVGLALVVTTQYHWLDLIGNILEEIFNLTSAEQGIVRGLAEGQSASTLATRRGTSEGTVRGQIKSVMSKMNTRSQSEIIRLVLSLRDLSEGAQNQNGQRRSAPVETTANWLQSEVWKPFDVLILPDGRKMDFHVMGPVTGQPVLLSHMGYCTVRLHEAMVKLAFRHSLQIICPVRPGYGNSENIDPKANVLDAIRLDTLALLDHLGIARLPYVAQGNDFLWAVDFAGKHPDRVSEIIGLCARPCLPGDRHYSGMGKWHRFFLSTGKHAPHLLNFTTKAAIAMGKRIGAAEMLRQMNRNSVADVALLDDEQFLPVFLSNAEMVSGGESNAAQAYAMEVLASEADWTDLIVKARETKTYFINGAEDPATDIATISEYRETYPWIEIEVVQHAGQLMLFQHYEMLIPRLAEAARRA